MSWPCGIFVHGRYFIIFMALLSSGRADDRHGVVGRRRADVT